MNKFPFLALGSLLLAGSGCTGEQPKSPGKPNIIFILTDDQRWDALGFAGNRVIRTPEMDRLASEGTYFRNAFVTTPICAASRASILTGMYERTHGYTFGQGNLKKPYADLSYPAQMRASGYYTGFFGKLGVSCDDAKALFDVVDDYDRNNRYKDRRGYFFKTIGEDTVHLTRYTGQQALDFISDAPEGRPFCLSLSFSAPHAHDPAPDQYFWEPEVDALYEDHVFDPPVMAGDEYFNAQPDYVRNGFNRTRWYWRFDTPEKYQHSMKGYYRMISGIDLELGRIRKLLKDKGIDKNTIIVLMGDNGYFLGERQFAGKWLMYEPSLRVPLIIYDPAGNGHRTVEDMALNIDIPSTIFEYAGIQIPEAWQGISLAAYTRGASPASSRESFLCEHLWENKDIPPSEGIRTNNWKYFRYRNDLQHEELYNLEVDPEEKFNLAASPDHKAVLDQLRSETGAVIQKLTNQKIQE